MLVEMSCSISFSASHLAVSPSVFRVQALRFNNAYTCTSGCLGPRLPKIPLKKLTYAKPSRQQAAVVCRFGKGKSEDGNESSPWKALEQAAGNFRKNSSVEDLLKQQMENKEFYVDMDDFDDGDGGSDGKRPGGGGGGGGDGYGYVGPEDEGLRGVLDELFQVTMTLLGLLYVYLYILDPEKVTAWTKDIIVFIFTRKASFRLRPVLAELDDYFKERKKIKKLKAERPPDYVEQKLIRTILKTIPGYLEDDEVPRMSREELLRTLAEKARANASEQ